MTNLLYFAAQYVGSRKLSRLYADSLKRRAAALATFTGQLDIRQNFTEPLVNEFLLSLDRSIYTIRSYRSDVLSLWNAAADQDLIAYPIVRRIVCPPLPSLLIDCYTLDEVRRILTAAKSLTGEYPNGVAKARYWAAAIALAWDAGFRRGDCWLFKRDAVRPDGSLRIVQNKTGRIVTVMLRQSTLNALDAVGLPQPCRWTLDPSFFGRHFKRLVKASDVGRGTFKWLRRASGSYVEAEQPGAGFKHLGHASAATFLRHYDAQLAVESLPRPPEL